ncbi:hypothetical protein SDC9_154755 [bioreactor metagenome]|uniref:Uncharacterized protein n=1 Tax=bioreactor metagenome TaxID=1076179 RepID=A0A645EZK1_9ZZZZ
MHIGGVAVCAAAHFPAVINVVTHKIGGLVHLGKVGRRHGGDQLGKCPAARAGETPVAHRVQRHRMGKGPVVIGRRKRCKPCGVDIIGAVGGGVTQPAGACKTHLRRTVCGPDGAHGKAVGAQNIAPGKKHLRQGPLVAGGMLPVAIAKANGTLRLVERDVVGDPALKTGRHHARVPRKRGGGIAVHPAALLLQRLRQLPVVQCHPRGHARRKAGIHHPVVIGKAGLVPVAVSLRVHTGPAGAEPVGRQV